MKLHSINNVVIIGTGRVGSNLAKVFKDCGLQIIQIVGRNLLKAETIALKTGADYTNNLNNIKTNADLYILAVSDDVIAEVAGLMPDIKGLVVHTSGFKSIDVLPIHFKRRGVFYPLQTFSESRNPSFEEIPLFIQTIMEEDQQILMELGKKLSNNVISTNDLQRKELHLAAVFVSNFSNAMYEIGAGLLKEFNLQFDYLRPLILETAHKACVLQPEDAQTGPARRNDIGTINLHLEMLSQKTELSTIYKDITSYILTKYHQKSL